MLFNCKFFNLNELSGVLSMKLHVFLRWFMNRMLTSDATQQTHEMQAEVGAAVRTKAGGAAPGALFIPAAPPLPPKAPAAVAGVPTNASLLPSRPPPGFGLGNSQLALPPASPVASPMFGGGDRPFALPLPPNPPMWGSFPVPPQPALDSSAVEALMAAGQERASLRSSNAILTQALSEAQAALEGASSSDEGEPPRRVLRRPACAAAFPVVPPASASVRRARIQARAKAGATEQLSHLTT